MRVHAILRLLGLALAASEAAGHASALAQGRCGPDAIGVQRVLEIDARGAPRFGHNQYQGKEILQDGEVVLTFDDGPHKAFTKPILDELDRHCTKAIFFMVGQRAMTYPDLAREVARRGHTVATHTWSHRDLAKLDADDARSEIEMGISALQKLVGRNAAPFFRFPYLSDPGEMRAHLKRRDTAIFSIDVDSYDFKTRSATKVINNVMRQLDEKGRGIILFHDIQPSTAGAIGDLLDKLKAKGYRVVQMVATEPQTTVARYDERIGKDYAGRRFAALPDKIPVSQRGMIAPAWEARVTPEAYRGGPSGAPPRPPALTAEMPRPAPSASAPPPVDRPARSARNSSESDWRTSVFRGW